VTLGLIQLTLDCPHQIIVGMALGGGCLFQYFSLTAGAAGERKDPAMKSTLVGLEMSEEEILAFDVSDEALESAAGSTKEKANFTLGACSGLSVCDG
jgi:hypothetical protein